MSSPRKRLPAGERRAQILRSAIKVFSRSNYRAATMAASVLQAAGYRTGLYTSPHLERIEERISIDGRN